MNKRTENEKKFPEWEETSEGRRYYLTVKGRYRWTARYVKEVDKSETTLKFYQEIYDSNGLLVEIHNKYPLDEGHKKVGG